jgi:hypothetical protein
LVVNSSEDDTPALAGALKDSELSIRRAAARALGKVGSLSACPEALIALKTAAKDDDPELRREAIEACQNLVGKSTKDDMPALITSLKDSEPFIRRAAAQALGKVGSFSASLETLAALTCATRDNNSEVRRAATEACESIRKHLTRRANKDDVPALIAALRDTEPLMRHNAVYALGKVSSRFISPEALTALKVATTDGDPDVRRAAAEAWENVPPTLLLLVQPVLELNRGTKTRFRIQVYRHRIEGPALVKFEGLPTGVLIPDTSVPADKNEAPCEAAVASDAPNCEVESHVLASAAGVNEVSGILICVEHSHLLAEAYLRQGRFAEGEAALLERLKKSPTDDQSRFGLGVLRFIRGVERLGQHLHHYGTKSENINIPFLRLPVPKNADPASISYTDLRRVLDDFHHDLSAAEATLADVTDDHVKLPLRLALIRLDLVGDGKANDKFIDILQRIMGRQNFDFLEGNPDFLVCFHRGDVAWLRAYCHLLMGMLDFYLAFGI